MGDEKELLPEKEAEMNTGKGSEKIKLKMTYSILTVAALFIIELYFMINFPASYLVIGILGLAILCFVYMITDYTFRMRNEKETFFESKFDSIYKGEKVNYVLVKKSFMDLEDRLSGSKRDVDYDFPVDDLIHAQKAVGKVTIQRGKENTAEILSAIGKMTEQFSEFYEKIDELGGMMQSPQDHHENQEGLIQAIGSSKDSIEQSMKDALTELSDKISSQIHAIPSGESDLNQIQASLEEIKNLAGSSDHSVSVPSAPLFEEPQTGDADAQPEATGANEDVDALLAEMSGAANKPKEAETTGANEDVDALLAEMSGAANKPKEAETTGANEDIDALLAEMSRAASVPEPESVPEVVLEPEPVPKAVAEEKSAMPEMADPGHVMTPDEIAALLANM